MTESLNGLKTALGRSEDCRRRAKAGRLERGFEGRQRNSSRIEAAFVDLLKKGFTATGGG